MSPRERIVEMSPAFDKRHSDPSKNYGVGAVMIRFVLKGEAGATYLSLSSGWYLPHVRASLPDGLREPNGFGIGYHAPHPQFDSQTVAQDECPYLDGKPCYSDAAYHASDEIVAALIREGSDAVWSALESRYDELFGDARVSPPGGAR